MTEITPRARWHRVISTTLIRDGVLLQLLAPNETTYARLPPACLKVMQCLADELLTAVVQHRETDARAQRALERIICRRIWNALTPFSPLTLGRFQQLDFDPYLSPASTRKWCEQLDQPIHVEPISVPGKSS